MFPAMPPRDSAEMELCGIWQAVIGQTVTDVNANFFIDFGGNSVAAVHILAEAEELFGIGLELADFFRAPTVSALAERIRSRPAARERGPMIQISAGQSGETIYVFHPLPGTALCYVAFAQAMGSRHAIWGLQSEGLEPGSVPLNTIEEMADLYAAHMRAFHSSGRWNLLGYSMGGYLAMEVARRLNAAGETIGLVGLLDSSSPAFESREKVSIDMIRSNAARTVAHYWLHLELDLDELCALTFDEQLIELHKRGVAGGTLPANYNVDRLRRLVDVRTRNRLAIMNYRPEPYPGTLTLIRSALGTAGPGNLLGLADHHIEWLDVSASLRTHDLPSDHWQIIEWPTVAQVADFVRKQIELD